MKPGLRAFVLERLNCFAPSELHRVPHIKKINKVPCSKTQEMISLYCLQIQRRDAHLS
jgi:hypothetical protein